MWFVFSSCDGDAHFARNRVGCSTARALRMSSAALKRENKVRPMLEALHLGGKTMKKKYNVDRKIVFV